MRYLLLAGLACIGCSDEPCVIPPCLEPIAFEITVSSVSGAPVVATVAVSGPVITTLSCSAACAVHGTSGTYELDVTEAGFVPVHKSIQVTSTQQSCGCEIVHTQNVQVTLVPSA
jgi:hypothetical protein